MDSARSVVWRKAEEDMATVVKSPEKNNQVRPLSVVSTINSTGKSLHVDQENQANEHFVSEFNQRENYENVTDFVVIDQPACKSRDDDLLPILSSQSDISIDPESDLENVEEDSRVMENTKVDVGVQTVFSVDQFFVDDATGKRLVLDDLLNAIIFAYSGGKYRGPAVSVILEIEGLSKAEEDLHLQSIFTESLGWTIRTKGSGGQDNVAANSVQRTGTEIVETATNRDRNDKKPREDSPEATGPAEPNKNAKIDDIPKIDDTIAEENVPSPSTSSPEIQKEELSAPAVAPISNKIKKKTKTSGQPPQSEQVAAAHAVIAKSQATPTRGYSICTKFTPVLSYLEENYFHRPLTMMEMDIFLAKMTAAGNGRPWCKKCGLTGHDASEKAADEALCWSLAGVTPFLLKKSTAFCKELVKVEKSLDFSTVEQTLKNIHGADVLSICWCDVPMIFGPAEAFERGPPPPGGKSMSMKASDWKLFGEFMAKSNKKSRARR